MMKKINFKKLMGGLIALPLVFLFVTSCFDITGVHPTFFSRIRRYDYNYCGCPL
jgi:hypothetical protein